MATITTTCTNPATNQTPDESFQKQFLHSIINQFNKWIKLDKKQSLDDEWEIPYGSIKTNGFLQGGSQGEVYYGEYKKTPVAIKRVEDPKLVDIKHLKNLNHPNIIKFLGISRNIINNINFYYIVMELGHNGTLDIFLHTGRQLPSSMLTNFTQQIASGMKYLHSKKIIHRDLKTQNILVTNQNNADTLKIIDFSSHRTFNDKHQQQLTSQNDYDGTLSYMAPEMIRNNNQSYEVDVWSYGNVVWEILICEEPYKKFQSINILHSVGQYYKSLPIPSTFPHGYKFILEGCWQSDPSKRLSFNQICDYLDRAIPEIASISNPNFFQMQAEWKKEIGGELYQRTTKHRDEEIRRQIEEEMRKEWEMVQKIHEKNNLRYIEVLLSYLRVEKLERDVKRREEELDRREKNLRKLEDELNKEKDKLLGECRN